MWKVWVENLLSKIRENLNVNCWRYVPADCNSTDFARRCNKKLKFEGVLWWKVPSFLCEGEELWPRSGLSSDFGDALDLNQEIGEVLITPAFSSVSIEGNICCVIDCERYSNLEKLLKVASFVKRFVRTLKARVGRSECVEEHWYQQILLRVYF